MAKSKKLFRGHWSSSEVEPHKRRFPTAKSIRESLEEVRLKRQDSEDL